MLYTVYIDGDRHYVRASHTEMRNAMRDYVKREVAAGRRLSEIEFSWAPIVVENLSVLMKDYQDV